MTTEVDVILAQMEAGIGTVPSPTTIRTGDVVERGEVPARYSQIIEAGYIPMWEVESRERSSIPRNQVPTKLKERLPNGKPRWTRTEPATPPWRGTLKCVLHPDNPERKTYDELGFPVCMKANFPNVRERALHGQNRHHASWATIEQLKAERERAEDRGMQHKLLAAATRNQGARTASPSPVKPIGPAVTVRCECGEAFTAKARVGAHSKLNSHRRKAGHLKPQSEAVHA